MRRTGLLGLLVLLPPAGSAPATAGCGGPASVPGGPAPREVVLHEVFYSVAPGGDWVEIKNTGRETLDLASWWLCSQLLYEQLQNLRLLAGADYVLAPGELLAVEVGGAIPALDDTAADLGLYTIGVFDDPNSMVDFLQWGTAGNRGRSDVAVAAGLWRELAPGVYDFVETAAAGESAAYCGANGGGGFLTYSTDYTNGDPTLGIDQEVACRIFEDGFEGGDTQEWTVTVD